MVRKTKFLLSALLIITTFTYILSPNSHAQDEIKERGWKGQLCKKPTCRNELLKKLKEAQEYQKKLEKLKEESENAEDEEYEKLEEEQRKLEGKQYVDGYIINGDDIINIIKESDIDIKIKNSFIVGGLDFRELPKVNGKREVNNKIQIVDSEFGFLTEEALPKKQSDTTDDLETRSKVGTHFKKAISFQNTTFSETTILVGITFGGHAIFDGVTFSKNVVFYKVTFSENAEFNKVKFCDRAEFDGVIFSGYPNFRGAIFNEIASFGGVTFNKYTNFDESTF